MHQNSSCPPRLRGIEQKKSSPNGSGIEKLMHLVWFIPPSQIWISTSKLVWWGIKEEARLSSNFRMRLKRFNINIPFRASLLLWSAVANKCNHVCCNQVDESNVCRSTEPKLLCHWTFPQRTAILPSPGCKFINYNNGYTPWLQMNLF